MNNFWIDWKCGWKRIKDCYLKRLESPEREREREKKKLSDEGFTPFWSGKDEGLPCRGHLVLES